MNGKTLTQIQTQEATANFDLTNLASGTYLVELTDAFGTQRQKFIKL